MFSDFIVYLASTISIQNKTLKENVRLLKKGSQVKNYQPRKFNKIKVLKPVIKGVATLNT